MINYELSSPNTIKIMN